MNIQNHMPKRAFVIFLRWWIVCWSLFFVIFLGAIVAFLVLMLNDKMSWQGIRAAVWSFVPGALIAGYTVRSSYRELRSIQSGKHSGTVKPPSTLS